MYFIHYSCYKHIEYVWRGIKTTPRPKNSTAPGPRPPVLKFLDPLLHALVAVEGGDSTLTSDPFISRSDLTFFVPWSWITQGNTTVWSGFTVKFSLCVNIFNSAATAKIQNLDNLFHFKQNHQLYILTKIFYHLNNLS